MTRSITKPPVKSGDPLILAIVHQLVDLLAPLVFERVLADLPKRAEEQLEDGAQRLSGNQAARVAKARRSLITFASKLPSDHPGHLKVEPKPHGGFLVSKAELSNWCQRSGPAKSRDAMAASA